MKKSFQEAVELLKLMIKTPSPSGQETEVISIIEFFLTKKNIKFSRKKNNIWAINKYYDKEKPTILLNSHVDTVKPNKDYSFDPFDPVIQSDMLFGLGSNDAGGAVVSLLMCFEQLYGIRDSKYNICLALTAEEEISGSNGLELILPELGELEFAIIGEPTQMKMAIAERGLIVLDCLVKGKAGHAAQNTGENAIYKAIDDINWFKSYKFNKLSEYLGPVKMSVTMLRAGIQHNIVPEKCKFVVDVRSNEQYSNVEILNIIKSKVACDVIPRSTRLNPSFISPDHPAVKVGINLGLETYASPTSSDQCILSIPSIKIGPGDSNRSHAANEFIRLDEIKEGIKKYCDYIDLICRHTMA